ncbi:hypothetical protein BBJ28_00015329 [Nothophytophthora sp. Chile5]|nr:hypothetical protein BBJ28_00015329 [Nothophytophthora sp. Chile5]
MVFSPPTAPDEVSSPPTRPAAKSFITEVNPPLQPSAPHASKDDVPDELRPAVGATGVFRLIEKLGEKQQRSKRIRAIMQRAAQKTILVVRAKNSIQAAEIVTIRFTKHQLTDVPRCVQLPQICEKVVRHARFASRKKQSQFQELFNEAREVDALLKDMFWYLTAHCFQPGRHAGLEANFYQRIADSFTALFVRLQMQAASRDSGFFDQLPDVVAQILFVALYEAFPRSRKAIASHGVRQEVLRMCHSWILGFVPAELSCSHWVAIDQDSPKRIAALADFPAMRNRMIRAERVERTKQVVRTRHEAQDGDLGTNTAPSTPKGHQLSSDHATASTTKTLPQLPTQQRRRRMSTFSISSLNSSQVRPDSKHDADKGANAALVETRERFTYEMCHSPLIGAFLARHQLEANASHLSVQLRLTSGKQRDLSAQEALRAATGVVPSRRRRLVDPAAFADALAQLEGFGDSVRLAYSRERQQARSSDSRERRQLASAHRALEGQLGELRQNGDRLHAFSNQLVSKSRIDALLAPSSRRNGGVAAHAADGEASGSHVAGGFTPHPPPPRRGVSSNSIQP